MRLVVLQSNYIPWKGYFDLISAGDCFVIYDSVQYTKNDWRNRNRLATPTGLVWLTIPVRTKGRMGQTIREAEVEGGTWAAKHWRTVEQTLGKRAFFNDYGTAWEEWYGTAATLRSLHDVNVLFLRGLAGQLGLATLILDDADYLPLDGDPTARLVQLCRRLNADSYLTGPAGLNYLESGQFSAAGIKLEVISYGGYPTYAQSGHEFTHEVSVLDLLASVGPEATAHLKHAIRVVDG